MAKVRVKVNLSRLLQGLRMILSAVFSKPSRAVSWVRSRMGRRGSGFRRRFGGRARFR